MSSSPRESSITSKVKVALNAIPGVKAVKIHGSPFGEAMLDILACRGGQMYWLEVKRPGGPGATPRQESTARKWQAAGAICAVVRTVEEALEVIKK